MCKEKKQITLLSLQQLGKGNSQKKKSICYHLDMKFPRVQGSHVQGLVPALELLEAIES
jgi:hypothetical protein